MMKIVIAPNSFKESLSAVDVAHAIEQGFSLACHEANLVLVPMADGGTGTLEAIMQENEGTLYSTSVTAPHFEKCQADFFVFKSDQTALIETAKACGLQLVPQEYRHPLELTSFGVGELILSALDKGCRQFILGLGGTATTDGGMGALNALGIEFLDQQNHPLKPIAANLKNITVIDTSKLDPRLKETQFILAHDVNNVFLGLGGTLMYAPQKGANATEVELLHIGFEHYALLLQNQTGKAIHEFPGTGAAGGLAFGLAAFLNAKFVSGAELVINLTHLASKMENAALVITAEGRVDAQTFFGKAPIKIAQLAKSKNIPVIAFAGCIQGEWQTMYDQGLDALFSIAPGPISKEESMHLSKHLLIQSAYNVARLFKLGNV